MIPQQPKLYLFISSYLLKELFHRSSIPLLLTNSFLVFMSAHDLTCYPTLSSIFAIHGSVPNTIFPPHKFATHNSLLQTLFHFPNSSSSLPRHCSVRSFPKIPLFTNQKHYAFSKIQKTLFRFSPKKHTIRKHMLLIFHAQHPLIRTVPIPDSTMFRTPNTNISFLNPPWTLQITNTPSTFPRSHHMIPPLTKRNNFKHHLPSCKKNMCLIYTFLMMRTQIPQTSIIYTFSFLHKTARCEYKDVRHVTIQTHTNFP